MGKEYSEFGKGLTYCIGLFLGHAGNINQDKEAYTKANLSGWQKMWFNGASDHLYEIDISKIKDEELKNQIDKWAEKVLNWGHGFNFREEPTEDDIWWAIKQAKKFLQEIDEKMLNIKTIKGEWE